jgi:hypothetical protein
MGGVYLYSFLHPFLPPQFNIIQINAIVDVNQSGQIEPNGVIADMADRLPFIFVLYALPSQLLLLIQLVSLG